MRCPSCGLDNNLTSRVCLDCGTRLSAAGYRAGRASAGWAWLFTLLGILALAAAGAVFVMVRTGHTPAIFARPTASSRAAGTAPTRAAATQASGTTPAASASATNGRSQATAVEETLEASRASRTKLAPAIATVEACGDVSSTVATMQQVVGERSEQLKRARALAVGALTNGAQLQSLLVQALQHSLEADQHFVSWAQALSTGGCSGTAPHTDDYGAAEAASGSATVAKQDFLQAWNPIATSFGLRSRTEAEL